MTARRPTDTTARKGRGSVLRGVSKEQSDGTVIELRKQTHRQKLASTRTAISAVKAIAADPHTHRLAHDIDEWTDAKNGPGGRPRKHPTWCLVLFAQCIGIFGSVNATAVALSDPDVWALVVKAAAPHLDPSVTVPDLGPSRDQYQYFTRRLDGLDEQLHEAFCALGAERAQQVGLADPAARHYAKPARSCTLGMDGKVFSSPLATTATERVDRRTGEIRTIRQDPARGRHREGGGSDDVLGTKFLFASIRTHMANLRVITDVRHISNSGDGGEPAAMTAAAIDTCNRLPGITTIVVDGAPRGNAINQIQTTTGAILVNLPRRMLKGRGGIKIDGVHYAAKQLPMSIGQQRAFDGCPGHRLYAAGGTIFELHIAADGTDTYQPLERGQIKKERKADGTTAMRMRFTLHCTHTGKPHQWWESLTLLASDEAAGFLRPEYLRAYWIGDPDFARIYGMRADTESLHAQLEFGFRKQRLPAWGIHRQTLVVLFAAMAHNAWTLATWHREVDRQQAPPGAAA